MKRSTLFLIVGIIWMALAVNLSFTDYGTETIDVLQKLADKTTYYAMVAISSIFIVGAAILEEIGKD